MVNFVHRFGAEYRQALAVVQLGTIGRVVFIVDTMASGRGNLPAWTMDQDLAGGGMMIYGGIHSVDRLAWLAGSPIAQVTAAMDTFCHPMQAEDNLVGTVVVRSGALGAVVHHRSDATATIGGWHTMIYGTHGAVRVTSGSALEVVSDKALVVQTTPLRKAADRLFSKANKEDEESNGQRDGPGYRPASRSLRW
jgi:predicted dehydrogenase